MLRAFFMQPAGAAQGFLPDGVAKYPEGGHLLFFLPFGIYINRKKNIREVR
jgi:hypothetical protein